MLPEVSAIMCSSSRQTATLQERRGKTSETATPRWHDPTKPPRNPFQKHRAQLRIPGSAKRRGLEEGVPCHPALFLGATLRDTRPAAGSESTGHNAGRAHVKASPSPRKLPTPRSRPGRRAEDGALGSSRDRQQHGSDSRRPQLLWGAARPPPRTSASEGPGHSPGPLRHEATTAHTFGARGEFIFFFFPPPPPPPRVVHSSHRSQQEGGKKSLIRDTIK